ncbi:MAG TPA: Vps62-related protein [Acidobacteriaceae bacterium]|nr:Vps62-related protein [Acidobacteriaceae bacterium]
MVKESSGPTGYVTQWLIETMRRNAPILIFHPGEQYYTYNVEDYLAAVDLRDAKSGRIIATPPLTSSNLPSGQASSQTYLSIPNSAEHLKRGDLSKTKIYVHALGWTHNGRSGFDFQYFFFYPYNGTGALIIRLAGLDSGDIGIPAGAHQGDWESIIVRTDTEGNVIGIYCNQHSDGTWYLPGDVQWSDGHPHIYVARSGHPSYVGIGHFPTPKGDFTISIAGYDFGVQLDNVTANGERLATAEIAELVATSFIPNASVTPPWWLDYLGRYGRVVFTKQDIENVEDTLTKVFGTVIPVKAAARSIAEAVAEKVIGILQDISPDGPEPPKAKGWWDTTTPNGPWWSSTYRWSGDVRISSLPGHLSPRSNYGPSLAVYGKSLYMVYKGEHSDTLYSAWFDGTAWSGNQPITISSGNPESNYTPGLAAYRKLLYMVYKGAHSNTLYSAWFDDTGWHGNRPITMANGNPESNYSPALAEYNGLLYMIYKGAHSNTLYSAWFDGVAWHGNKPISVSGSETPESNYTPALAVYGGRLYMIYKGAHSNTLYFAWFDGQAWHGNTPIRTPMGTPESNREPWAAVADGHLMVIYKGKGSTNLYWTAYDANGNWWGNSRIGQVSSIRPRSGQTGGAAAFNGGLVTVYKADNATDDFFQAQFLPSTQQLFELSTAASGS